jgi:hypothetical protein
MRATRATVTLQHVTAKAVSFEQARAAKEQHGTLRAASRSLGVSPGTVTRALAKGQKGRIVDRVRQGSEFKGSKAVEPVRRDQPIGSWTLQSIREARDAQMRGDFKRPVRLAEACLFNAYHNRLAPHNAIATELKPVPSVRGEAVAKRAAASVQAPRTVLEGILGTLANHGIAIGYLVHEVADDGSRTDFRLEEWPLEHVKWNATREVLETRVKGGGSMVDIVHGDSHWIVFRKFANLPWTQEACLLPAAMLWAGVAFGMSDWAQTMKSHGQAKIAAALPSLFAILEKNDAGAVALTPEAAGVLQTLQDMVSGEAGAGIFPDGTKLDFLSNGSNAWQVFKEFVENREKSSARIYNGTDATMGSQGGAPGVDIAVLFGVQTTKVQGDFKALEEGMNTGAYQTWCAINEGDSRLAPALHYMMPDPDAETTSIEATARYERLFATLEKYKAQGMAITQAVVNALAALFGITENVPQLASGDTKAVPIELAPADVAKIVRVGPALRSLGLDTFGDERDNMTITELDEATKAKAMSVAPGTTPAAPPDSRGAALHALCKRISESELPKA